VIKIYFAGPLFTTYEREFIEKSAAKLRKEGFEVFVPHENIDMGETDKYANLNYFEKAMKVFKTDYEGLAWANVMIAMIDGTQVDDGTATEIGMFCQQIISGEKDKIGIYGLSSDMRVNPASSTEEGKILNFFTGGAIFRQGYIYTSLDQIIEELKKIEKERFI
jgi:hypothetical protein